MSIPIMISMLVQALYNVVDSIFVAQLSEDALNAVSLAFPIQNLMISVAVGTGVGINALLSKSLGEKRQDRANAADEFHYISFWSSRQFGIFQRRNHFCNQGDVTICSYHHVVTPSP